MNALSGILRDVSWMPVIGFLADVTIKSTLVCAAAAFVNALLLRRASAHARNAVWIATIVIVCLLPLTAAVPPVWRLQFPPPDGRSSSDRQAIEERLALVEGPIPGIDGLDGGANGTVNGAERTSFGESGWQGWIVFAWFIGMATTLGIAMATKRRIEGLARAAVGAGRSWEALAEEVSDGLELKRRVPLYVSGELQAAVTIGVFDPVIVLPASCDGWPVSRRRFVLSHELAHVKRRDGLVEIAALAAVVFQWFNPVVRQAVRQLRIERERDCDDAVINAGARPSDYAMMLMDIAADLGSSPRPIWQLSTISQGSSLKERLMCILDPKIDRNRCRNVSTVIACVFIVSMLAPAALFGLRSPAVPADDGAPVAIAAAGAPVPAAGDEKKMTDEELKKKQMMMKKKTLESIEEKWKQISVIENSAAAMVARAIEEGGIDKGKKLFKKLAADESGDYYFEEKEFNTLGYYYLYGKKVEEANAVFGMNAKRHPDSWNVWDSLAEARLVAGDYEEAKTFYEKSIAMNPENDNGKKMLQKIEYMEQQQKKKQGSGNTE